jgi:hypothetical protein
MGEIVAFYRLWLDPEKKLKWFRKLTTSQGMGQKLAAPLNIYAGLIGNNLSYFMVI